MAIVMAHDIAWKLIHTLGLNDQFVGKVIIKIEPDSVVEIEVTHFMTDEQSKKLIEIAKNYYLVERPKPPVFPPDRKIIHNEKELDKELDNIKKRLDGKNKNK